MQCLPITSVLFVVGLQEVNREFKASLGCTVTPCEGEWREEKKRGRERKFRFPLTVAADAPNAPVISMVLPLQNSSLKAKASVLGQSQTVCQVTEHIPDRTGVLAKGREKASGKANYTTPPSRQGVSVIKRQCPPVTCTRTSYDPLLLFPLRCGF